MAEMPALLESMGGGGIGLRVEFVRRRDRLGHTIWLVEAGGKATAVLESVEGLPTDDWPPSPPLQSLHVQDLPDSRRAALLVGMAGRSHWSASIETVPGQAALRFDIACKRGAVAGTLGSRYRLLAARPQGWRIEPCDERSFVTTIDREVLIGPAPAAASANPTQRWQYRIALD